MLTRTLGYRTLEELEDTMSAAEFALWAAEYAIAPWGEFPADVRSAINGAVVARSMGSKVDVSDLIPKWDKTNRQVEAEMFFAACRAHNERLKQQEQQAQQQ